MTNWAQVSSMYVNSDAPVEGAMVTWGMFSWKTTRVQKRHAKHTIQIPMPNQVIWPSPWSVGQGSLLYPLWEGEENEYLLSKNENSQNIYFIYCKIPVFPYKHAASTQTDDKLLLKGQDYILFILWPYSTYPDDWRITGFNLFMYCFHWIFLIDYF